MKSSIDMLPQTFLEFLLDERAIERKYRFTRMPCCAASKQTTSTAAKPELKSETSFKARKLMGKTKIEQIGGRSGTFKS